MTPFATYMHITQQVYVAEEWVRNAHDEVKAEAHSHFEIEKALRALKEHTQLFEKLKEVDKARLSAEAGLKTAKRQAEDQRQNLHITKINLVTEKKKNKKKLFWILRQSCREPRMQLGWPGKSLRPR